MTTVGDDTGFVPLATASRYAPPKATISGDKDASWLRRAFPIVLAHRAMFAVSVVTAFASLVVQVQIPDLVKRAIDQALTPPYTSTVGHFVAWIAALGLLRWALGFVSRLYLLKTAYRIEFDLRNIMYEHFSKLSFSFYDRVQSGQLISRANSDIRSVQMYLAFAPNILTQCAVAVVAFAKMLSINAPLAVVAMATMPFLFVVGVKMRARMFPVSWVIQSRLADVSTVVDENINGVRVVKSFAAEVEQLRLLAKASKRVEWANIREADLRARWSPSLENLPRLGQALVLLYGGWLAFHGHASVGTIVAFNSYVLMLQPPFRMLGLLLMMGQRAAASAKRIYEILDEEPEIVDRPGAQDLRAAKGHVRFEDVDFAYPSSGPVLQHLDLELHPGETVALVGRTGTGKSTVARLLARFYDVTGGRITIDGHDVRDVTLRSLRHHVGMVLDEPFLFSVSIRDNIAYGRPDAAFDDVVAAARAAGADEFITRLPLAYDTVVGERGYTLSGGQRQRIAIARTLLVNPPVLVLDDATSAIDVQVEQQIHGALRGLMRGRTTLIIAHRLSTIGLADRVALLENGRVVATGTHAELLATEPRYAEVLAHADGDDDADADGSDGHGPHLAAARLDAAAHAAEADTEALTEAVTPGTGVR